MKKVSASRGWQWVLMALGMVRRWPGVFGVAGLIAAGVSLFPLFGSLALLVFGPALVAGLTIAARRADRGETPTLNDAFTLFRQEGRLRPAMALCVPIVVGEFVVGFVMAAALFATASRAGVDLARAPSQSEMIQLFVKSADSLGGWMALSVAIMLFAYAFVVLAIPRVGLQNKAPFPSMGESMRAVIGNVGPWLVAALTLFLCVLIPAMFLMMIQAYLLVRVFTVALIYSVLGPMLYLAWRDVAPEGAGDADETTTPPPSFEA